MIPDFSPVHRTGGTANGSSRMRRLDASSSEKWHGKLDEDRTWASRFQVSRLGRITVQYLNLMQ